MSAETDQDSRTEEPSERKLNDAVEKGNVPFSREAVTLGSLLGILLVCKTILSWSAGRINEGLALLLENAGLIHLEDRGDLTNLLTTVLRIIGEAVLPVCAVIAAAGIIAALVQNVPQAPADRIAPKWSRVSPLAGLKRIGSLSNLLDFAKTLTKFVAISVVTAMVLNSEPGGILSISGTEPAVLPAALLDTATRVVTTLCVVALLLTIADVAWSRFKWRRSLMMTRQEMKEEFRQSEGDPHIRARVRSIARQRASKRMFKKLPTATMVITNPTHYAVALRYTRTEGGAPVVVAKGLDFLAQRIREIATEHQIPLVENKPLARALHEKVEIDDAIPAEFYKAVAEIIHYLELRKLYPSSGLKR